MEKQSDIANGMPNDLVLVRHGLSEANQAHKSENMTDEVEKVTQRADWQQRLALRGIEQARATGHWLESEFGGTIDEVFDKKYVSHFVRTAETALHLGGVATTDWRYDKRLVERSWGIFGSASREERKEAFAHTVARQEIDPLYTAKDGGEALATDVLMRWRDYVHTLHREAGGERVLAVTHGELMWVARFDVERMLPEDWIDAYNDQSQWIRNCSVLHYSRVNPDDPEHVSSRLQWMRLVHPDAPDESPYGGQWRELSSNRRFNGTDLASRVNQFPRYLDDK